MKRQKKGLVWMIVFLSILALAFYIPYELPYRIYTRGLIVPAYEWSLARTLEGNLISAYKDNIKGSVDTYGVTEFQRGDVVEFRLNPLIYQNLYVQKGDTIGVLYSNEEERRLIQLQGDYDILKSQLIFYTTGQKPEDVQEAEKKLALMDQELATQKGLMERMESLYRDSLISDQHYEIELNKFRTTQLSRDVAEAQYLSAITGDKPEQAELIQTQMVALQQQIQQIKTRLEYFTLLSPLSGMVVLNRGSDNSELLITIADTSSYVVLLPIDVMERKFVTENMQAEVRLSHTRQKSSGIIRSIDNVVQWVDSKQAFFATAIFSNEMEIMPGTFTEVVVHCENINIREYISRILDLTFS